MALVQCFTGLMSVDKFNEFVLKRGGGPGQVEISESNELGEAARLQLTGLETLPDCSLEPRTLVPLMGAWPLARQHQGL